MKNVEDIYPMSPMQELMLLHLLAERDSVVLFDQMTCAMHGELDVESFRATWQYIIDRHPMLRTAFLTKGLERPLQVVRKEVSFACDVRDWRGHSEDAWRAKLDAYLEEDRQRGFDPTQAPLMRVTIMQVDERQHLFVMSVHHVVGDRWSMNTVLNEAMTVYESLRRDRTPHLAPVVRYRDYVEWLMQQDLGEAESYWRTRLAGFTTPTPLPFGAGDAPAGVPGSHQITVDASTASTVASFARDRRVTMSVLFQAVWGMVLAHTSGEQDVVFGATMSGRPAELPGVEGIVGLFINNLPVRVTLAAGEPVGAWLESLQEQHGELQQFEHTPLAGVQEWSELAGGQMLFDSLIVFQNDPARPAGAAGEPPSLELRPLRGEVKTKYALTLIVAGPVVQMTYDRGRFDEATIVTMLRNIERLLERIPADPSQLLESLLDGLDTVPRGEQASPVTPPSARSVQRGLADHEVPGTELEVAVARVWQEVIGVEPVGLDDNFFDVGGNSVLALQTLAKLESELGAVISPGELMMHTLRQVAAACHASRARSGSRRRKRKWWQPKQRRHGA